MRREVPLDEIEENQDFAPALLFGEIPLINPESPIGLVIEEFLASQIPNGKTARGYRRNITLAFEKVRVASLSELRPVHLMSYRSLLLADRRSSSSHAQALIAMRSFLRWGSALQGHTIPRDQMEYLLKVPKTQVITPHQTLTDKEIPVYIETARFTGPRELALVLVALGTGVRVAELCALDVQDLLDDASGGLTVHVQQGKGGKDRMIPTRQEVAAAVDAYLQSTERIRGSLGPLFMAQDNNQCGTRLSTKTASRLIKELAERAGIKKRISPHALRHTFAFTSYIYCRNLVAVQRLLGHATIATTQRYVNHLDQLDLRKAIPPHLVGGKGPKVLPSVANPDAA